VRRRSAARRPRRRRRVGLRLPGLPANRRRLGATALDALFARLGLFDAPVLPLRTAVGERPPLPTSDLDLLLAATGQGALTVTPLHVALITAALAGNGTTPAPRLVDAVQSVDGAWQPVAAAPSHAVRLTKRRWCAHG
jgi:cell division protein FtsI/penicillin-binding protein 2